MRIIYNTLKDSKLEISPDDPVLLLQRENGEVLTMITYPGGWYVNSTGDMYPADPSKYNKNPNGPHPEGPFYVDTKDIGDEYDLNDHKWVIETLAKHGLVD